ncbi:MAG: hypothetical protein EP297_07240 [Gammaproteobacteria bacterium]|nr:MAG: hypothetical protein EP297_07240 [Gammaproteobacteria bacterium]
MKIGRTIGISVGAIAVILVIAVIYLLSSLDSLVAEAIKKYGSQVTQTTVDVSSVSIDIKDGAGAIDQLTIANPKGFSSPHIFTLGNISTAIDVASINKDPIVIKQILIKKPYVFYEINKAGASNLKELEKNIEQSTTKADDAKKEQAESSGPKLLIRELVIEGGKIDAQVAALDKPLSANLPRIHLNNIGEKSNGATGAEVAKQIVDAIIAKVGPEIAKLGLEKYIGKSLDEAKAMMSKKVSEQVGGSLGGKVEEGVGGLKKLIGK